MTGPDDIKTLNQQIREASPIALEKLAALPSPCVIDAEGQSPLNVAIDANNSEVFSLLIESSDAREFAPAVHSKDDVRMMRTIYASEGLDAIDEAERRILKTLGVPPYWQRTPLLQACRCQNRDAIRALISRGAKLTAKDLVGETPLSLCVRSGGAELAQFFIECCMAAKKPFPLSVEVLEEICGDTTLYAQAVAHGRPNPTAKKFIFNLACATLDRPTIEKMLDDGFDVNAAVTGSTNPVIELVTSRLAWMNKAAQWTEFAAGYANYNGHPDTISIHVSNNPGPGDLTYGQTLALHKKLNESVRRIDANPKFMTVEARNERMALLGLLINKGLDVKKVRKNLDFPLTADVISSNEPDLAVAITKAGFSLAPDDTKDLEDAIQHGCFDMVAVLEKLGHRLKKSKMVPEDRLTQFQQWRSAQEASPAIDVKNPPSPPPSEQPETWWNLFGESSLTAEVTPFPPQSGEPCTIRLHHSNTYGPFNELKFEMRVNTKSANVNEDGWQPFELVRETVYVDDVEVDLASLDEPPYGETPWVGSFEATATLAAGKQQIVIRITAPDPDNSGTLNDWMIDVSD